MALKPTPSPKPAQTSSLHQPTQHVLTANLSEIMVLYYKQLQTLHMLGCYKYVTIHHKGAVKSHTSVGYFDIFSEMKSLKYSHLLLKISELNSIKKIMKFTFTLW